jgi:penicillin-binding protein 1A
MSKNISAAEIKTYNLTLWKLLIGALVIFSLFIRNTALVQRY